jgi:nucleoid DNA-binding protein
MLIKSYVRGFEAPKIFPYLPCMPLENYISELLYRYNCVVIPNFGAFLAHEVPARINTDINTFYAPSKALAFNGQLKGNDGLLVSYIAESEKTTYDKALSKISKTVEDWKAILEKGEKVKLMPLGSIWYNAEHTIQYDPAQEVNYLTTSFGLTDMHSLPMVREELQQDVAALEEKIPFVISPEVRKQGAIRPYIKYAAIFLLAFSTGMTGYQFYKERQATMQFVEKEASEQVNKQIQEATFFDAQPLELPTITVEATAVGSDSKSSATHHIIAGAFRYKGNAERKIRQLQDQGYPAAYYGINAYGLHMVSYDRYENAGNALQVLRKIKREQSPDAWLLSEK